MKRILAFLFLSLAAILYFFLFLKPNTVPTTQKIIPTATTNPSPSSTISRDTLFVPYWSDDGLSSGFSTYVYFSVTPTEKGINTGDNGYAGLPGFVAATQGKKTLLTVSMLSGDTTEKILQDTTLQEKIIQDSLRVAKSHSFDGIVLDLEYGGLAFPSVIKSVTDFSTTFARDVKAQNLAFYQAVYGDSFYLARPYDIAQIAKQSDGIFVLAYDFHKANGTPGPNFPLTQRDDSDYSFTDMVRDFTKKVPPEKLTIIFGMFGYDWTIDSKNRPTKMADSLSDTDIASKFISRCSMKDCKFIRDSQSQEPSVTYIDNTGAKHIIWFEDLQSVGSKEKILQQYDVTHVGLWANGYF